MKDNWIPVREKLPEKDQPVLIYEQYPHEEVGLYAVSYWDGTYSKYDKSPQFPDGQDEQPGYYYPTHWQPLPQPPQM